MVSVVWPIFRPERRRRKHNSAVLQWESLVTPVFPSSGEQCMLFCSKDWAHQQPWSLQNTDFQFAVSGTMALVHRAQWLLQSHLDFEFDGMAETCVTPASLSWHLILAKTVKPRCQLYQKWYAVFKGILFTPIIHCFFFKYTDTAQTYNTCGPQS